MNSLTSEIKNKLDVVDVLSSYIKLEKAGQNYKARCPFHHEKTPSFFVSPKRGSYYCFGCGAKGDIFSFVEQFEGLDFMGSLKVLAERAGVKLRFDADSKAKRDETERLYDLMDAAATLFENNLKQNPSALNYLIERGLTQETIKLWRLGFAKDEWHDSEEELLRQGFKKDELYKCGLTKTGESGKVYDVFRSRIMFPIFDGAGRVIAFSGRIFGTSDKDMAKYLNSPETLLFKKSETLYGYQRAKTGIRRLGFAILVEGQMDLLMCHQAGYDNTVATSGTALTKEHLGIIKRLTSNLLLAYDNDTAGNKATMKAFEMAISSELHVKVLKISQGKDPADLILSDKEAWKVAIKDARDIVSFVWDNLIELNLPRDKFVARFRESVLPLLSALPSDGERTRLISGLKMAVHTGIREEFIMSEVHAIHDRKSDTNSASDSQENHSPPNLKFGDPARRIFAILFGVEDSSISGLDANSLQIRIKTALGESFEQINERFKNERSRLVFEAENIYGNSVAESEIEELLRNVEEDQLREKLLVKMKELQKAEEAKQDDRVPILLAECQSITKRISEIKAAAVIEE
jgi:DNA primase